MKYILMKFVLWVLKHTLTPVAVSSWNTFEERGTSKMATAEASAAPAWLNSSTVR